MQLLVAIGVLIAAFVLIRIWTGAMNVRSVEQESLSAIEEKHPYLPHRGAIVVSVIVAVTLLALSFLFAKNAVLRSFLSSTAVIRTIVVFAIISAFGIFDRFRWHGSSDRHKYFYAFVLGTVVTWILIAFKRVFFETGVGEDPFLMALGITCVVVGWRFMFGPWSASIKATVLGTFVFWVCYAILRHKTSAELIATGIASIVAIIPVIIWCRLFLSYHKERTAIVLLAFFAGMLSTAPILFYSELTNRGIELNFFLFRIVPVHFGSSSEQFVAESIFKNFTGTHAIVLTTLMTYLMVGLIEEISKYWVLRHSSRDFFRSIDDVLQLSIIVALGFAFAENIVNPSYFVGFVQKYLLAPGGPQWGTFIGSTVGRSVLTVMVHVLSTGVIGYFFGLAFFASPLIRDQFQRGTFHPIFESVHRLLSLRTERMYARCHILFGLTVAIVLHGLFDFIVTLPDVLPGNPSTVGQLLGSPPQSFLSSISITLLPSILYVVGGFWLLAYLFERKEDMKEFGQVVETQAFVS